MIPRTAPAETTVSATAVAGTVNGFARNGLVESVPSIILDAEARNTAVARRFVFDALREVAVDGALAALLVSELVSNVIRHAATTFEVVVTIEDSVRVEVRDGAAITEAFRDLVANPPRRVAPAGVIRSRVDADLHIGIALRPRGSRSARQVGVVRVAHRPPGSDR